MTPGNIIERLRNRPNDCPLPAEYLMDEAWALIVEMQEALANIAEGHIPRVPDKLRIPGSQDCDHGLHLEDQRCDECVCAYARATLAKVEQHD